MKLKNNKGFTMVELLVVLAIIAVLAAVAIPVYSNQLEKSREKVDESNLRAATGLAAQDYLVRYTSAGETKDVNYIVLGLTDDINKYGYDEVVPSENMIVYPENAKITKYGEVIGIGWGDGDVSGGKIVLPTMDKIKDHWGRYDFSQSIYGKTIHGKQPVIFPLQQNKGNAHFDITIGENGVIKQSRIVEE